MSNNQGQVKELYSNDIVYKFDKNKKITFGVVVDSFEASSDVADCNLLQRGQILVLWNTSSREHVWNQNKVKLMSRSIIPGDIVRRLEDGKETQRGYCKDFKRTVTVQIVGTDKVIEHVSSTRLHGVRPFDVHDIVCLGDKFGRIETVDQEITLSSKCGSVVQILTSINHDIKDYWLMKRNRSVYEAYYPGQELICIPYYFEQPEWIKKSKLMKKNMQKRQRFTVQSVKDSTVIVRWCNDQDGTNTNNVSVLTESEIKQLKVLDRDFDYYLDLSSRHLLKLSSYDNLIRKKFWLRKLVAIYHRRDFPKVRVNTDTKSRVPKICCSSVHLRNNQSDSVQKDDDDEWMTDESEESDDNNDSAVSMSSYISKKQHYPPRPDELVAGNTLAVEILCMECHVTVVWQDGIEEKNIPSTQLYYSISLDDHEFFPGEWVVHNDKELAEYGVVQNVNYMERTAVIKWFTFDEKENKPTELRTEEMSVYDLKKHQKFIFRPGSIVKTIQSRTASTSCIGIVIDSWPEGIIKVKWMDGTEESCLPQQIEVIPNDYEHSETDDSIDDGHMSWETETIESYAGDMLEETSLQNVAARLDFVRNRLIYLGEAFKQHVFQDNNLEFMRDLLLIYDNSSYLDKLLGTSFFCLKSVHFKVLLDMVKEKSRQAGIELKGRLFNNDNLIPYAPQKLKHAEKENINKVIKIENKVLAQVFNQGNKPDGQATEPSTPDSLPSTDTTTNLCLELISMLKLRMDLAYAEIISKLDSSQGLSIMTQLQQSPELPPMRRDATHPEDLFSISSATDTIVIAGQDDKIAPRATSTAVPLKEGSNEPENLSKDTAVATPFTTSTPIPLKESSEPGENPNCDTNSQAYAVLDEAPITHHFYPNKFEPTDLQRFLKAMQREYKLMKESLPPGVWVRFYSNRIDLLSVMIEGPAKTPYEDGLFIFDVQLSPDYPRSPPLVHYISYSSERFNPNLYVEGKVCISLLGTWMGHGTEVWGPKSTLLQLMVSVQGLILVSEPYFNEAGYEKQTDTQQGYENSRTYNELVILKLVQSMQEMIKSPSEIFKKETMAHFAEKGAKMCQRLESYCDDVNPVKPEFPLLPVSKGLKLSLRGALKSFQTTLDKMLSCENKEGACSLSKEVVTETRKDFEKTE